MRKREKSKRAATTTAPAQRFRIQLPSLPSFRRVAGAKPSRLAFAASSRGASEDAKAASSSGSASSAPGYSADGRNATADSALDSKPVVEQKGETRLLGVGSGVGIGIGYGLGLGIGIPIHGLTLINPIVKGFGIGFGVGLGCGSGAGLRLGLGVGSWDKATEFAPDDDAFSSTFWPKVPRWLRPSSFLPKALQPKDPSDPEGEFDTDAFMIEEGAADGNSSSNKAAEKR
eukprot:tig00020816_g14154.t1